MSGKEFGVWEVGTPGGNRRNERRRSGKEIDQKEGEGKKWEGGRDGGEGCVMVLRGDRRPCFTRASYIST